MPGRMSEKCVKAKMKGRIKARIKARMKEKTKARMKVWWKTRMKNNDEVWDEGNAKCQGEGKNSV
jgi:hypothetical protein